MDWSNGKIGDSLKKLTKVSWDSIHDDHLPKN